VEIAAMKTTEQAVCSLCGEFIMTTNGGRKIAGTFVTFERLLDLHMEQKHANVCVLPEQAQTMSRAA
jgi:hypothetical protein